MDNIKTNFIKGVFWSAVEKYSSLLVSIVISMILARLLSPSEYGIVAIATVIIVFLQIFCSMGIGPAIIQRKDLSKEEIDDIFSCTIYIGVVLCAILFFASYQIGTHYDNKLLVPVCQILSISLFFDSANMVPNALMAKNQRFKDIAKRTLLLQFITGVLSIYAAYKGAGVYSLLMSPVITSIGIFFYNVHFYPVSYKLVPSFVPVKKIFSYSAYQFGFEIINYFSRNLDKLIIGKFLSTEALGYYEKSYRLMQLPLQKLTSVINPVLQPVMSNLQDNMQMMALKYTKIVVFIASVSFPIAVILYFSASDIIVVMYGEQWKPAISVFKILSLSIPTQMILSTSGGILQSCNATKYLFWIGLVNTIIVISGFIIGLSIWGTMESVAWGWSIASIFSFVNTYSILYYKIFRFSLFEMMKQLWKPFCNALLLVFSYLIFNLILIETYPIITLILELLIGGIITLSYLILTKQINIYEIKKYIHK